MTRINLNNFFFYNILFFLIIVSCARDKSQSEYEKNNLRGNFSKKQKVVLTKEQRLELFLESPVTLNSNLKNLKINGITFNRGHFISSSVHDVFKTNEKLDTIIRFTSQNNDVIEILKNYYVEHIIYLKLSSKGIQLNGGIYLGMTYGEFYNFLPLKMNHDGLVFYRSDDDFFEIMFYFDGDKILREVNYYKNLD